MYYKLFNFGEKEVLDIVQIPGDIFLKEGDVIQYDHRYCKILKYVRVAASIQYNGDGVVVFPNQTQTKESLSSQPLPELYLTEIPRF